jgi:translocation and assembly module TamA
MLLLWAGALAAAAPARAADPQPYTVTIQRTNIGALDSALRLSSQLVALRTRAPVGPFALIGRGQQDRERLATVLESFGYYQRKLTITIEGQGLDDPGLPDAIGALERTHPAKVNVAIQLGPLYHVRRIAVEGEVNADARRAMQLESGAPAVASNILGARDRLLDALEEQGHALAKVDAPVAYELQGEALFDVTFTAHPGPSVRLGEIRITGLKRMHEAFIRKRFLVQPGEPYAPSRLERERTDLLSIGVFASVTVHPDAKLDDQGRLPVTFELQERPLHAINLSGAYSSDLGGSVTAAWTDRDLFGNGEQLNLSATAIDLGGNATTAPGYNLSAQFMKPDVLQRGQSWQTTVTGLKQDLIAYDQTALTASSILSRKLSKAWQVSFGLSLEHEQIEQEGPLPCVPAPLAGTNPPICPTQEYVYTLIGIPLSAKYDSTNVVNPLDDALHGMRATVSVTPTESLGNGHATTFTIIQGYASTYYDLERLGWTAHGRSVIALRAVGGIADVASQFSMPPDQRFYAGGSATVRGFQYQSIGPQFNNGIPTGGTALEAGTAEFRQRFGENFGAAFFVDAGQVTATTRPLQGTPSVGYGSGLRYYTPIGPIRLDVALPSKRPTRCPTNSNPPEAGTCSGFEIYVGLGQVF